MKISNPTPEKGNRNGGIGPDHEPTVISVNVSHGVNQHEVSLPSNSSFGHLKSLLAQKIGLNPETHKLLFRGKEKEDDEDMETAGVKENSKILLVKDMKCTQNSPEEVKESNVISKGCEAVAEIKAEVDKLSEKVSALQSFVDSGTKVDEKEIVYLTEMLMRQLLKLDGIEAEGEGKVQRKLEVRRVQDFVDTMDILKSRNANPTNNPAPVTTQWESFGSDSGNANNHSSSSVPSSFTSNVQSSTPSPMQASEPHYHVPSSEPHYPGPSSDRPYPDPSPAHRPGPSSAHHPGPSSIHYPVVSPDPPYHGPSSAPYNGLSSNHFPAPTSAHYPIPSPAQYPVPSPDPSYPVPSSGPHPGPYSNPYIEPYSDSYPGPYSNPYPVPYSVPHQVPYPLPYPVPYPSPYPMQYPSPYPVQHHPSAYPGQYSSPYPAPSSSHYPSPYSERSPAPSSAQVTRDWERFD